MYYAEYETEGGAGFAICETTARKQEVEAQSRRLACQLLAVPEADRRTTYELWCVVKNDGRLPRLEPAKEEETAKPDT